MTIPSGGSTSVGFFVQPSNTIPAGDANGCNSTGADPATATLSVPADVTASSTSLTFVGCGVTQSVTFSSNAPGTYTISVSGVTGGKSGSLWDTSTASFTLVVTATVANQTITVTTPAPASATYGSSFGVAATAWSGLAVAITTTGGCSGSGSGSTTITMTSGTVSCVVHYNQAGNASFNPAPEVTSNTTAQKMLATWTTNPASKTYGDADPSPLTTGSGAASWRLTA